MLEINIDFIMQKLCIVENRIENEFMHKYVLSLRDCGLLKPTDFKMLSEKIAGNQYYYLMEEYK